MVSRDVCKACGYYKSTRSTVPFNKKEKVFKATWRCRKDVLIPWDGGDYSKVLCSEENPAKGCPKLMDHAIACGMSR
jgi:hypothetical protein